MQIIFSHYNTESPCAAITNTLRITKNDGPQAAVGFLVLTEGFEPPTPSM